MSTTFTKQENVAPSWNEVSADGAIVGRLAVRVARVLMGKHRPDYTPHVDDGDYVVVTHAEGLRLTGRKAQQKVYRHHSGYVGGLNEVPFEQMMVKKPEEVLRLAVRRMLPKNKLARKMLAKLKIYRGDKHPHAAQKPQKLPE